MTIENPSVFPSQLRKARGPGDHDPEAGMTLRDWFASQALPATLTAMANGQHGVQPGKTVMESAAADAYAMADAMLAERAKGGDQ